MCANDQSPVSVPDGRRRADRPCSRAGRPRSFTRPYGRRARAHQPAADAWNGESACCPAPGSGASLHRAELRRLRTPRRLGEVTHPGERRRLVDDHVGSRLQHRFQDGTASRTSSRSSTSRTTGRAPGRRSMSSFATDRVVAVTSCPAATSIGTSRPPITPLLPRRSARRQAAEAFSRWQLGFLTIASPATARRLA